VRACVRCIWTSITYAMAPFAGTHTAMKSGMLAADAVFAALSTAEEASTEEEPMDLSAYQTALDSSWVKKELDEVRNVRPSFHSALGNWGGIMYSGIDSLFLKGRTPWTFHHPGEDHAQTKPASSVYPLE
jgi:electron-transferring-flavoprotein dehydrogenase